MRIKEISHNQMKSSVSYLYEKTLSPDCPLYAPYSFYSSKEQFFGAIESNISDYKDATGREVGVNNTIKHAVVSFHPRDAAFLNLNLDKVMKDVVEQLGIKVEEMNLTAFVHNDKLHPHVHLIWSRVSNDQSLFNDSKIGVRFNQLANDMDKKYSLSKPDKKLSFTFHRKELYSPTSRGEFKALLGLACQYSNSVKEFDDYLKKAGFYITKNNLGQKVYINKDRVTFNETTLPGHFHTNRLPETIKKAGLSKDQKIRIEEIKQVLSSIHTLDELKEYFPESRISYTKDGNSIYNLKLFHEGEIITMSDCNIADIKILTENVNTKNDTILVSPIIGGFRFTEEDEIKSAANKRKRRREIGLKVQISK